MLQFQYTVRDKIALTGKGLHTGQPVRMHVFPAQPDTGIVFMRPSGRKIVEFSASHRFVVDNRLSTTLAYESELLSTVEHFLAAAYGLGIDNLRVEVSGPEVPIMDGSAAPFVEAFLAAGIEEQAAPKKYWLVTKRVQVRKDDRVAMLRPAERMSIECAIDFNHPVIAAQHCEWVHTPQHFLRDIGQARTFGLLKDVEALKSMGLIQGGGLDNAVVVGDLSVLNPEGLRYGDEFVRHKILDAIGDLALLERPLLGKITLHKAGHALHHALIEEALRTHALVEVEFKDVKSMLTPVTVGSERKKLETTAIGFDPAFQAV